MTALALLGQTLLYPMSDMSYASATLGQLVFKKLTSLQYTKVYPRLYINER